MVKHYIMNFMNFFIAYINHQFTMYAIKNKLFIGPYMYGPYNRIYVNTECEQR